MAAPPRAEPVTGALEPCFPLGLKGILDPRLEAAVDDRRDTEGPEFAAAFRYVHAAYRHCPPGLVRHDVVYELAPGRWGLHHQLVNAGGMLAGVDLRNPPDTQ